MCDFIKFTPHFDANWKPFLERFQIVITVFLGMKTDKVIGKHPPGQPLQDALYTLVEGIIKLGFHPFSFVLPDEPLYFMDIKEGCMHELTDMNLFSMFLRKIFLEERFNHFGYLHQVIILIPYDDILPVFIKLTVFVYFIDNGVRKGHAAARVLDKIIFFKIGPGKYTGLFVKHGRAGEVHQRPKKSIGKFAVIAVHVASIKKDEPHVKIIILESEMHPVILKEDPNGASKLIRAVRYRRSKMKENPEIEAELKYLQRNRRKMNYFELQQNKLPIGSGVVEAACKNLIGARMKKSGMRWTINGGQTVLTLRSLILSNRWEDFWTFFVNRHFPEFVT